MCQFNSPNITRIPQKNRSQWCDCERCGHCGKLRTRPLFPSMPNRFPPEPRYPHPNDVVRHEYIPPNRYNGQPYWEVIREDLPTYRGNVTHDYRVGYQTTCVNEKTFTYSPFNMTTNRSN